MINNIYVAPNKKTEKKTLEELVKKSFAENEKVRFIFDLKNETITIDSIKNFSDIFDKFKDETKQKLVETCVIIQDKLSAAVFKKGLDMVKLDKPVKII